MTHHLRLCLVLSLFVPAAAFAQTPATDLQAIRSELEALRQSQDATRKEVEAIKALLQQAMGPRPAPAGTASAATPGAGTQPLKIAGRPAKGATTARITLVEYSDYECPFCAQYAAQVYPQIDREYVKTGKLRYVFKNYPIEQIHSRSFQAHEAAACAGDQGRYFEMHDKLFADQGNLHLERYVEHALALGLDAAKFRNCIEARTHEGLIREDVDEAARGGVRGTPVFVLGLTDPKGQTITAARVIVGAQPFANFKDVIDALLSETSAPSTR